MLLLVATRRNTKQSHCSCLVSFICVLVCWRMLGHTMQIILSFKKKHGSLKAAPLKKISTHVCPLFKTLLTLYPGPLLAPGEKSIDGVHVCNQIGSPLRKYKIIALLPKTRMRWKKHHSLPFHLQALSKQRKIMPINKSEEALEHNFSTGSGNTNK